MFLVFYSTIHRKIWTNKLSVSKIKVNKIHKFFLNKVKLYVMYF